MLCSGRLKGRLQKLLLLEALAVGALVHGGVGLVRADLDGVQTAVLGVLTVVGELVTAQRIEVLGVQEQPLLV